MATITNLLQQIPDKALRERLNQEITRINNKKKFGLVFEEHEREYTPLYNADIKLGTKVSSKSGEICSVYTVIKIVNNIAVCINKLTLETKEFKLEDLVAVAQFGEPIYPSLVPMDKIQNASSSHLWHSLIEADNYHALQLLRYFYEKQVDCIYIDPPYNTGARDWKYNNDYVDSSDNWRHSKWLSMIKKRLKIAKQLLKADGVLIIAIDHNELAHLICLLEGKDMFPEYDMTIVTVVHNPRGNITTNFAEVNEYAIYLTPKSIRTLARNQLENKNPRKLRRWGHYSKRCDRPSMFYPIYIKNGEIIDIGEQPSDDYHPYSQNIPVEDSDGVIEIWPIDQNGVERRWNYSHEEIHSHLDRIVALPKDGNTDLFVLTELSPPKTVWMSPELDAGGMYGSSLVEKIVGVKFPYPKSLYTVLRSIEPVVRKRPNAIVVDFFAGSGTTLHAVNLINAEDCGNRRCILVTNNEVSINDSRNLLKSGFKPGDSEWEKHGICREITWPRTKYSILGQCATGDKINGEYFFSKKSEKSLKRRFTKLSFTSKEYLDSIERKKQLVSLIGKGKLPQSLVKNDSRYIVSEKHSASILFDETSLNEWIDLIDEQEHITEFYIVTSSNKLFNDAKTRITEKLGDYIIHEPRKISMSEGFKANVEYFRLDFLDRNSVSLGLRFNEILPLLWLKSGAIGKRPELQNGDEADMLILSENGFAVLIDETKFAKFKNSLQKENKIQIVFYVTNSEESFHEMSSKVNIKQTYQLYRDYIDNFVLGSWRDKI